MIEFYTYSASTSKKKNILVFFTASEHFDLQKFTSIVDASFKKSLFTRDILIISATYTEDQIEEKLIKSDSSLRKLKEKINSHHHMNIHYSSVNKVGEISVTSAIDSSSEDKSKISKEDVKKILETGLFGITKSRNLIIEAHPNYHFVKPSGKHTSKFIKVSNIIESSVEISFIAFCLLKMIPDDIENIYIDTAGIFALAYEITALKRRFDNNYGAVTIDCFGSYEGIDSYSFSESKRSLVIISATTSSDLEKKIRNIPEINCAGVLTIVSSVESKNTLICLDHYRANHCKEYFSNFDSYKEEACNLCRLEQSVPISLHKSNFAPESPRTTKYLPLAIDADKKIKELISNYKNLDVFKCLYDGVDGKKSPTPEYFIDVELLLKDSEVYREKIDNFITRSFPLNVDTVLHCSDSGAKQLADYILENVNSRGGDLKIFEGEITGHNIVINGILVVAGSLQSGKSLLNISRSLRDYTDTPITYVVGFAKYKDEKSFIKLQKDLTFSEGKYGQHLFYAIESILLPIDEHRVDSWAREIELFNIMLTDLKEDSPEVQRILEERIKFLKSASANDIKGLGHQIFLPSPKGKKHELGPTFAFWSSEDNKSTFTHQATVYYTISSILQTLRTKAKAGSIPLGHGYLIKQLDPFLFDRFNEGIIHASFLRAAKPKELDYSGDDESSKIIGSLIERMFENIELKDSDSLPEFLLALCTQKIQIKKDHMTFLQKQEVNKDKYPLVWALNTAVKKIYFTSGSSVGVKTPF